jgi:hypothetical protein
MSNTQLETHHVQLHSPSCIQTSKLRYCRNKQYKSKTDDGRGLSSSGNRGVNLLVFQHLWRALVRLLEFLNALFKESGILVSHNLSASLLRFAYCRCTTFQIKSDSANTDLGRFETFEFGLFFIQKYEFVGTLNQDLVFVSTCVEYPDDFYDTSTLDNKWKAAIVLQVVSWVIGLILVVALFVSTCVPYSPHVFGIIGLGFVLVCCLFEGMIFLVFDSILCTDNPVLSFLGVEENYNNECGLGYGSSMIFIALFGYFFTGITCCCLGGRSGVAKDGISSAKLDEELAKVEEPVVNETVVEDEAAESGGEPNLVNKSVEVADNEFESGMVEAPTIQATTSF